MVQGRLAARFVAFGLIGMAACTSSSAATLAKKPSTSTTVNPFAAFTVQISGDAPAEVQAGVRRTLDAYLERGVVTALKTGAAGDIAGLLTADIAGNVAGADHATLVDDGIPGVVRLEHGAATAAVTAAGADLASARFEMTVTALAGTTPVTIHRTGDIAFVRDGDQWRIDGYDLHVTRDSTP